jgi:sigma-B regulation protein RsbU (phosphoserine phosphatase)
MWEKKEPVMIENVETSERVSTVIRETFGIRSMLLTPLMAHGEIVGSLVVDQGARPRTFTPHEISVVMGIANQAAVAIENARLNQEAEGKKRLEYELSVARQIQESFLPAACPVVPGYEICSAWRTAREVSGDFYDFVSFGPEKLALMIADVSDKGMPAALFMVLARTILRTMVIGKPTLREALERANDIIIADAPSDMFVTTFYALLDADHHHLTYVNAGHNPPFLYRHREGELTALKAHGMALAVFPNIRLEEQHVELEPGDALLLYTDGVTEAIDAQEKEFGAERLGDLFAANAHRPVQEIVDAIVDAVTTFTGDNTPFDDVTLMVVKRKE